jgi:methylmalonyl-CoA mutase N-terminal domain/subunit
VERGESVIVGVNKFADDAAPMIVPTPDYSALERGQVERVKGVRAKRNATAAGQALEALGAAAVDYAKGSGERTPLMPLIIEAVRARCTVGEISDALRARWGAHLPT